MTTLIAIGGFVLMVIGAIFTAFKRGGRSERDRLIAQQKGKNDAIQKEFDRIDSGKPDFDAAIDRLSNRAGRDGKR